MGLNVRLLIRVLITLTLFIPFLLHNRADLRLGWISRLENMAYDMRLVITMPRTVDDRIVIVDVDENSLVAEGQWPWRRDKIARLVNQLFDQYRIKAVGFDMVFAEADDRSGLSVLDHLSRNELSDNQDFQESLRSLRPQLETDRIFADSLRNRNAVLGYIFRHANDLGADIVTGSLPEPTISEKNNNTDLSFIEAVAYSANLEQLQRASGYGGFFESSTTLDADGVYRRVPLIKRYHGDLYESLAFALIRVALENPPIEFIFAGDARDDIGLEWLEISDYTVPVDSELSVLVPYRGPVGSFPYVSATDVLNGTAAEYPLRNAIVLIGTSAPGLRDLRTTPVGEKFTGVEVHANIVSGILDQRIKQHPPLCTGRRDIHAGCNRGRDDRGNDTRTGLDLGLVHHPADDDHHDSQSICMEQCKFRNPARQPSCVCIPVVPVPHDLRILCRNSRKARFVRVIWSVCPTGTGA